MACSNSAEVSAKNDLWNTAEKIESTKNLQKGAGVEQLGITRDILPLADEPSVGGSTNMGNISWITPTMSPLLLPASDTPNCNR